MKNGIIELLRKDKRILVIAFIVLALVLSIFSKAYVSASDNDMVTDAVADVPELTADVDDITLQDSINAAGQAVQKQADVLAEDASAANNEAASVVQSGGDAPTPSDGQGTAFTDAENNSGNSQEGGIKDGSTEITEPPATETPTPTPTPIPTESAQPEPTQQPAEVQPSVVPLPEDTITLPADPAATEAPVEKKPEIVMIDPGTEMTPQEAEETVVKPIEPSKEQEANDLDNETDKSSEAVFPDGYSAKGDKNTIRLSYEEIMTMLASMPEGTDVERQMVVLKAYSLVGKVSYFWGGKSEELTWDPRWGNPARVTSEGSKTSGTMRSFGLDCSGYVTWVFNNAAGEVYSDLIGHGSSNQWFKSQEITDATEALPGDLAFFAVPGTRRINHVGVVIGLDENGRLLVAHCSSSRNNVVITEFRSSGFHYLRRPNAYDDESYLQSTREMLTQEDIGYAYCWMRSEESEWQQAEVGDLVFKQSTTEEGMDLLETGVIRMIDEDGKLWVSKMPYNASSEVYEASEAGYQSVRKPTALLDQKIKYKLDENNPFAEDDFVVMLP